jgi:Tol biopolymer transport system component
MGQSLAFMGDGRYLLTSAATDVPGVALSLWDLNTGKITRQIPGLFPGKGVAYNGARLFATDPGRKIVASIAEQDPGYPITFYDSQTWELVQKFSIPKITAGTFVISPDGKSIAVGTVKGYIEIFDIASLKLVRTIDAYAGYDAGVEALRYSPDGRFLASGSISLVAHRESDGTFRRRAPPDPIRIWSVTDGTLFQSFSGNLGAINGLEWSPDGQYLASASSDHTVRLWRVGFETPGIIVTKFSRDSAYAVAFSPDGKWLAACGQSMAIISEIER